MAYDLEEQEKIDELKAWWQENSRLVVLGVVVFVLAVGGFQGWRYYRDSQALAAGTLYEQLAQAVRTGDRKKVWEIADQIVSKYGATPYAVFGALSAARASFEVADLTKAKSHLAWVIEHARQDQLRDIARLRLAAVLLDEKDHVEALKLVETRPVDSMAGLYADLRGDILLAQGNAGEARSAYQLALDTSEAASTYRATIQLKLDALGEAKPAAAKPAAR
jgi:predicted negative regulator of RcsB-dependent stress response